MAVAFSLSAVLWVVTAPYWARRADQRGRRALMRLGLYGDDEVVAVWRRLGAETGLPMVVIQEDGAVSSMGQQVGRLKLGAVRIRRRHGLLAHRRPRFLTRRKTARLPLRPLVYRDEALMTDGGSL